MNEFESLKNIVSKALFRSGKEVRSSYDPTKVTKPVSPKISMTNSKVKILSTNDIDLSEL